MSKKNIYLVISILLFLLILYVKPLGLSLRQSVILASTAVVILWWATNSVSKTVSSVIIVLVFFTFSGSSTQTILKFPLSGNLILIAASYLIAHGIKVSGLADRISRTIISRYAKSGFLLAVLSFVLSFILIFLIPQPFPRAIIMAALYSEFLNKQDISARTKSVLLFSIFVAVTATSMAFINGDVIFNNAALQFAGISLTWPEWAKYMLVPSIIISMLMLGGFVFIFYDDIKVKRFCADKCAKESTGFTFLESRGVVIISAIILLWATESLHGVNSIWVSVIGVLAMHIFGLIKIKDYKIIKPELLLFLTAAFSIGGVLNQEGIAEAIFEMLLPSARSDEMLIFFSILMVMALHVFLGSSMTTMSICMPVLMSSLPASVNPVVMMFTIYTAINIHYILPIHHVVIMIGEGEGLYDTSMTIRYGVFLTMLAVISVYAVLMPYWRFIGVL